MFSCKYLNIENSYRKTSFVINKNTNVIIRNVNVLRCTQKCPNCHHQEYWNQIIFLIYNNIRLMNCNIIFKNKRFIIIMSRYTVQIEKTLPELHSDPGYFHHLHLIIRVLNYAANHVSMMAILISRALREIRIKEYCYGKRRRHMKKHYYEND